MHVGDGGVVKNSLLLGSVFFALFASRGQLILKLLLGLCSSRCVLGLRLRLCRCASSSKPTEESAFVAFATNGPAHKCADDEITRPGSSFGRYGEYKKSCVWLSSGSEIFYFASKVCLEPQRGWSHP